MKQVSECLPAELLAWIDGMENREGAAALNLTVPPQEGEGNPMRMGIELPVYIAPRTGKRVTKHAGFEVEAQSADARELNGKGPEAVKPPASERSSKEPTRIAPRVMPARKGRTATDMDMTTAHRRNRSEAPRSAVVISMLVWKAEKAHSAGTASRVAL